MINGASSFPVYPAGFGRSWCIRPSTLAAGQADGIQPRTIEVLQVCPSSPRSCQTIHFHIRTELWACRRPHKSSSPAAHGSACHILSTLGFPIQFPRRPSIILPPMEESRSVGHCREPSLHRLLTSGCLQCTGRAPDVTAPTARFPFEVSLDNTIRRRYLPSRDIIAHIAPRRDRESLPRFYASRRAGGRAT